MKNYSEVFNNMVERTKNYLQKNNLHSMVLGISGGIDSTVVAIVCHEISKRTDHRIKFIGVSLPSKTNGSDENDIAKGIGVLCDRFVVHSIEQDFNFIQSSFDESTKDDGFGEMNPLQLGNIKARIRMMYLYNLSHLTGGVTMDTDNLTEHYTGFFTIHGDVFDLNCGLADLWKHEVYELASHLYDNYDFDGCPEAKVCLKKSINIVPTDGNGVQAGGDLAQIAPGLTYTDVDNVLENEIFTMNTLEQIDNQNEFYKNYGKDLVDGIVRRYRNSNYKRKGTPICINIETLE